jgi:hypothetical protein
MALILNKMGFGLRKVERLEIWSTFLSLFYILSTDVCITSLSNVIACILRGPWLASWMRWVLARERGRNTRMLPLTIILSLLFLSNYGFISSLSNVIVCILKDPRLASWLRWFLCSRRDQRIEANKILLILVDSWLKVWKRCKLWTINSAAIFLSKSCPADVCNPLSHPACVQLHEMYCCKTVYQFRCAPVV